MIQVLSVMVKSDSSLMPPANNINSERELPYFSEIKKKKVQKKNKNFNWLYFYHVNKNLKYN